MVFERFSIVNDVIGLFYPQICCGCDSHLLKQEKNLCLNCLYGLPKTYFWDYETNPIEKLFWGRLEVSSACTFLHYEKEGVVQKLMHRFKYEGKSGIGTELGRTFGYILKEKRWFTDADLIVPIPLHVSKEQRRGYNQSAYIADGMGEAFEMPVRNRLLSKEVASESQTRKSRFDRSQNVDDVFEVMKPAQVKGKNVLLVDDVVTTGATLESAGKKILDAGASRLYIATIAVA